MNLIARPLLTFWLSLKNKPRLRATKRMHFQKGFIRYNSEKG